MIWIPIPEPAASALVLRTKELLDTQDDMVLLAQVFNKKKSWEDLTVMQIDMFEMWDGYEPAFATFGLYVSAELKARGAKQYLDVWQRYWERTRKAQKMWKRLKKQPPWWGLPELHASHRLRLCQLDRAHYVPKFASLLSPKDTKTIASKREVKLVWPN